MGIKDALIFILSYLLGCINVGYYYARHFYKLDIRKTGTYVTGATNVGKLAGKKGFIITFLGDAAKGVLVVMICRLLKFEDVTTLLCILMVLLGHIFPIQLKFHGGKGISTCFGAFLVLDPVLIILLAITSVILFSIIKKYTITALFALLILPLELFMADYSLQMVFFVLLYSVVIIFACRSNLQEYINTRAYQGGKENKTNRKK